MIKVILWDIDATLLNFLKAESYAVKRCFETFGFGICTDDMVEEYSKINESYWKRLERGEVSRQEVFHGRYREFLGNHGLPTDQLDTLNEKYQEYLSEKVFFEDYGYEIIQDLKGHVKQYVVTNGSTFTQERKMKLSGFDQLFDGIFISEIVGAEKPSKDFFDHIWKKIGHFDKEEVLIVGDSLTSDMQGGNNADILCCWYNPKHLQNDKGVRLDYEIDDLRCVKKICGLGDDSVIQ